MTKTYTQDQLDQGITSEQATQELWLCLAELGITMTSVYIPWSESPQAKENPQTKLMSRHWHWRCVISLGRDTFEQPYHQGPAINPTVAWTRATKRRFLCVDDADIIKKELAHGIDCGCPPRGHAWGRVLLPKLTDVMGCLLMDSEVVEYRDFAEWADELGFNSDSIKDREVYESCLKTSLWLMRVIGQDNLRYLRTVAHAC